MHSGDCLKLILIVNLAMKKYERLCKFSYFICLLLSLHDVDLDPKYFTLLDRIFTLTIFGG
jgi:hypothetical protein